MPSAADTLIARLQADCTAAEAAERAVRAEVEAQLKEAEQARAFAWRRPIAAFRAFEAWYEADRGQPFLQVFERYMPPTPVVEF